MTGRQAPPTIEIEIEIGRIVLHGYPDRLPREIGPLVEQRLAHLVDSLSVTSTPGDPGHPAEDRHPPTTASRIAAGIADQVWAQVRSHAEGMTRDG